MKVRPDDGSVKEPNRGLNIAGDLVLIRAQRESA